MDFLEGLNPQQRDAVCHVAGPLLILAGAGSGKTRVITHRICHLMHEHRVPGRQILAVTFTNKAADEMRDRVRQLLSGAGLYDLPSLSTFHSFCVRLLRRDGARLAEIRPGFTPGFLIYDEDDQLAAVKAVYREVGLDEKFMPQRSALAAISRAKNSKETAADWYRKATDAKAERLAVVYDRYEEHLRRANALDFDDLLLEAVRLLRHDEAVRCAWNERLRFLLIDEYQDTNRSQYELILLLCQPARNVCAVGDEDQSIYGWRGADIRNILDFENDFPDAVTIRLERNYRSTRHILDAASSVVARNVRRKGKWLWTESDAGAPVGVYDAPDAENEALFIADTTERILAAEPGGQIAILYRTNAQSRQIEEALRRYGRAYSVVGGLSFYQRAEIKDILAYLKLLVCPHDPVSLLRILNRPARGIGQATVEEIERHARERGLSLWDSIRSLGGEGRLPARAAASLDAFRRLIESLAETAAKRPLGELMSAIALETGYREMLESAKAPGSEGRVENLDELINAAAEAAARGEGPVEFLDHAALIADADAVDERASVSLLTLHNAKGLEWPVVFIAGLEEGLFPHSRAAASEEGMEEERRLCYVGMTRARKRLFLTWARYRRRFGGGPLEPRTVSRFIREVPAAHTEFLGGGSGPPVAELDLSAERFLARESARRNAYSGKTYNSLENIAQFFEERGLKPPPPPAPPSRKTAPAQAGGRNPLRAGATVEHPRFGRGMILRREGEGEEAKLTVSFPGYGLKKMIVKYAGLKAAE